MLMVDDVQSDLSVVRRGRRVLHPRVVDNVLERRAFCRAEGQAPLDKLLALCGDSPPEQHLPTYNLFVLLEWNVPTNHVIQQDAQRPHGRRSTMVAMKFDPLWWTVNTCTVEIGVNGVFE